MNFLGPLLKGLLQSLNAPAEMNSGHEVELGVWKT